MGGWGRIEKETKREKRLSVCVREKNLERKREAERDRERSRAPEGEKLRNKESERGTDESEREER